jgi:hypothetical protein
LLSTVSNLVAMVLVVLLEAVNLVFNFSNSAAGKPLAVACVFNWSKVSSELCKRSLILLMSFSVYISTLNWLKSFVVKKAWALVD